MFSVFDAAQRESMSKRNQRLIIAASLLISVLFMALAFRGLHPEAVLESLGRVNLPLVIAAGFWYFAAMLVISLRWGLLLNPLKRVKLTRLFQLVAIGYMGNNVYPFRSGEALRAVLLNRWERIPLGRIAATVVVERVFDGLVMLCFVLLPLLFIELAATEIRLAVSVTAPIFVGAMLVFLVLAARPDTLKKFLGFFTARMPARLAGVVNSLIDELLAGLVGLRSLVGVVRVFVVSALSWGLEASVYWLVAIAFGLDVGYPPMLVVVGTVNLAGLVPSSPGQFGVFEFFASLVLMSAGVPEETAVAYALLVHLTIWLPPTLLGFGVLTRLGLGFSAVTRAHELERQATDESVATPTP